MGSAGPAAKLWHQAARKVRVIGGNAGQLERGRHHVVELDDLARDMPFCHPGRGYSGDQWDVRQRIVAGAGPFFHQPIIAAPFAVIGENEQRRVGVVTGPFERGHQLA